MKTIINPMAFSRPTDAESQAYVQAVVDHRPPPTATTAGYHGYDSDADAWKGRNDDRYKQGYNLGGNIELIGSPEYVAENLVGLKQAGIDGIQLGFYDFAPDLDYFVESTLPLMKEAGLRL